MIIIKTDLIFIKSGVYIVPEVDDHTVTMANTCKLVTRLCVFMAETSETIWPHTIFIRVECLVKLP